MQTITRELLRETMEKSGRGQVKAGGFSMFPYIRDGDLVCLENRPPARVGPGDIIAFFLDSNLIIHRVLTIRSRDGKKTYITRGDAFWRTRHAVPESDLAGVAVWCERRGLRRRLDDTRRNHWIAFFSLPHFLYSFFRLKLKA